MPWSSEASKRSAYILEQAPMLIHSTVMLGAGLVPEYYMAQGLQTVCGFSFSVTMMLSTVG